MSRTRELEHRELLARELQKNQSLDLVVTFSPGIMKTSSPSNCYCMCIVTSTALSLDVKKRW